MSNFPFLRGTALVLAATAMAACAGYPTSPVERDADEGRARAPSAPDTRTLPTVAEAFVTASTPQDNIDSPAVWATPEGHLWLIATAKATDQLVVYDGATGETLRRVGHEGKGAGQFNRPNGVAVVDDLLFVVERNNHRVQVLRLPDFTPIGHFGRKSLEKPYGVWVQGEGAGRYSVYVTDAYMAGEDAQGEDILPPLAALDRRVKHFVVRVEGDALQVDAMSAFGDTTPEGALRVVESIWGDPDNDRLLIAEEDESWANELKEYDLQGRYRGRRIGGEVFQAQAEGIMLRRCADGSGWWITTEQGKHRTVFHLFDRRSLVHVGAFDGRVVANTDGIWLHASPSPAYPDGVLYAVNDDQGVVAFDWRDIAAAFSLPSCPVR